jgi:eukaryotic-like serine/threonine-protein kinase
LILSSLVISDSIPSGSMPSLVGSTFHDRYDVVRNLSTGGMGSVYEAIHVETHRRCALKVMLPSLVRDAEMLARFKLECTVASNFDSEHIVQVLDAGVDAKSGLPFLVMELLQGQELFTVVEQRGALPPQEVVTYLHQVALALEKTHAAGVIHRDLKPENLFVTTRDDGSPRVKILDFGIAKVVSRQDRITQSFMGTPLYMAPEQLTLEGELSVKTDNYALGQLAFTFLVGVPYWDLESQRDLGIYKLVATIARGAPEPASARAIRYGAHLDRDFDEWFRRATAADPSQRFSGPLEQIRALADALAVGVPSTAIEPAPVSRARTTAVPTTSALPPTPEPRSSRFGLVAGLVVLAALGSGVGAWAWRRQADSTQSPSSSVGEAEPVAETAPEPEPAEPGTQPTERPPDIVPSSPPAGEPTEPSSTPSAAAGGSAGARGAPALRPAASARPPTKRPVGKKAPRDPLDIR